MPDVSLRERMTRILAGARNPETGQRQGGLASALRGGRGQLMSNPISAVGDRIGRGLVGWVNNRRTDRLEAQHRQDLIDAETRGQSMPGPVALPRPGGIAVESNGSPTSTGMVPFRRRFNGAQAQYTGNGVSQFRDLTARTGSSRDPSGNAFDDAVAAYAAAQAHDSRTRNQAR